MLDNRKPDLQDLNKHGKALTEKTGSPEIQEKVTAVNQKYNVLKVNLDEREDLLEKALDHLQDYDTNIARVETDIPVIQDKVESLAPVSSEPDEAQEQLQEVEELQVALTDDRTCLESAQDDADWLAANASPEPEVEEEMKERIMKVKDPLDELSALVNERQNVLKCGLVESVDFKSASDEFILWLNAVEEKLAAEAPVTSDVEFVRELKREHAVRGRTLYGIKMV